ncbi:AAA domain-containing protein [Nonomuraea solani]|uniref:AAA domain-containing protein n=1 Tax=Nonomuraea solani TaxID=1144553 RepID=A0A1H6EZT8_9ACTN|nr:AAA family ATPase [Nonomuraea solani]SEH02385.1 AAA domain-containing protein [Nonomuraea solani]
MASAQAKPAMFLPGPVPDRTIWSGWDRFRRTRHDFVPAPRITLKAFEDMSSRQQRVHNLHRVATHSNLAIQETPMSAHVAWKLRALIEDNALNHGPDTRPGAMLNGGGCQGKTETICEVLAAFEEAWLSLYDQIPGAMPGTRDLHAPVAYIRTPVKATPISTCQRILDFYGEDYKGMRQEDLIRTVKTAIYDHATKALVLDDITRLKLHREADQDVLDLIRELMSLPVTLILVGVGIPSSGLLRDGRRDPRTGQWLFPPVKDRGRSPNADAPGQTDLRFDLLELGAFTYDTKSAIAAWTAHLVGIEQQLRLLKAEDGMLSEGDMPEYLYRRTGGVVGLLRKLIQSGCRYAIETGRERLTIGLLDELALSPADLPDLDPESGEMPHIPEPAAAPARKATKPRNTVYDDRGACETAS